MCSRAYDANRLQDPIKQQVARDRANAHYYANREKKRLQVAEYQMKQKLKAMSLLGSKCLFCPETHPAALQFHHRDPRTKSFNMTTRTLAAPKKRPWHVIVEEINKCDLLCANCHAKHHSVWVEVDGDWVCKLDRELND